MHLMINVFKYTILYWRICRLRDFWNGIMRFKRFLEQVENVYPPDLRFDVNTIVFFVKNERYYFYKAVINSIFASDFR